MITEFKLPPFDDTIATATIVAWRKEPGERIEAGDVLLEVVTEKVNVEIECPFAGRLIETVGELDQEIKVGDVLARIET
ncbi:MAG TPA: biotin/lipoyl-containing protein [Steroidobacteraceae bacterium]|nr:biotin/lipoyl-containing protein [Steroidobacteraceae bacterium]